MCIAETAFRSRAAQFHRSHLVRRSCHLRQRGKFKPFGMNFFHPLQLFREITFSHLKPFVERHSTVDGDLCRRGPRGRGQGSQGAKHHVSQQANDSHSCFDVLIEISMAAGPSECVNPKRGRAWLCDKSAAIYVLDDLTISQVPNRFVNTQTVGTGLIHPHPPWKTAKGTT